MPELPRHNSSPRPAAGSDRLQRLHLHEALARALCQAKQPLLLAIDDLQWCDPETIEWLHYFVRSARQAQVLLIGAASLKSWRISIRCAPSWWTCELPGC